MFESIELFWDENRKKKIQFTQLQPAYFQHFNRPFPNCNRPFLNFNFNRLFQQILTGRFELKNMKINCRKNIQFYENELQPAFFSNFNRLFSKHQPALRNVYFLNVLSKKEEPTKNVQPNDRSEFLLVSRRNTSNLQTL